MNIFLDTDTKINVITRKVIKNTSLTIWRDLKLELIFYSISSYVFLGFYQNIKVPIEELKTIYQTLYTTW